MTKRFLVTFVIAVIWGCQTSLAARLWNVSTSTELNQAVSELKSIASQGGTINLAPGTYVITQPYIFTGMNRIVFAGSGWNTIVQRTGAGNAFDFNDCGFVTLTNMIIAGDAIAASGSGIVFRNSSCCTVNFCRITDFAQSGIRFEGTAAAPTSGNRVADSHLIGNREYQVYSFYNNDFFITGNQFGTHSSYPKAGTWLDHSSAGTYTRNYHWGNEIAFKLGPASNYNRVENNRFEESRKEGIVIGNAAGGDASIYNLFIGNTIHTNSQSSSGTYCAVLAYDAQNTTFCGNQIFSWNAGTYITKNCLDINTRCKNWIIKENIMRHAKDRPVLLYNPGAGHIVNDNLTD